LPRVCLHCTCLIDLLFLLRPRQLWRSIVTSTSVCVCLSVRQDISGNTRAIFSDFSVHVAYGRGSVLLPFFCRVTKSQGKEQFRACLGHSITLAIFAAAVAAAFAAKGIIQSPITSCSRRDHLVCQTSANRNPENSERRDAAYQPGGG